MLDHLLVNAFHSVFSVSSVVFNLKRKIEPRMDTDER
jgi:hypothetical protein